MHCKTAERPIAHNRRLVAYRLDVVGGARALDGHSAGYRACERHLAHELVLAERLARLAVALTTRSAARERNAAAQTWTTL